MSVYEAKGQFQSICDLQGATKNMYEVRGWDMVLGVKVHLKAHVPHN